MAPPRFETTQQRRPSVQRLQFMFGGLPRVRHRVRGPTPYITHIEANVDRAITLSTLNEERSNMVYVLTMLQGPPLLLLKKVLLGNGIEAGTLLVGRYDEANASPLHHMLQCIMRPKAFAQDAGGFVVVLNEWEHFVQRWDFRSATF